MMTTKEALSIAMQFAAAHLARVRSLAAIANDIHEDTFIKLTGQHPVTMKRDLEWAEHDFIRIKGEYESFCKENKLVTYATWNYD